MMKVSQKGDTRLNIGLSVLCRKKRFFAYHAERSEV